MDVGINNSDLYRSELLGVDVMVRHFHCKVIMIIFLILLKSPVLFCDDTKRVSNIEKYLNVLSERSEDVKAELRRERNSRLGLFTNDFDDQQSYDEYKDIERDVFISISFKAAEDVLKDIHIFKRIKQISDSFFRYCSIEYSKNLSGDVESILPGETSKLKMKNHKEYRVLFSLFDHNKEITNLDFNSNLNILYLKVNTGIYYSFRKKEPKVIFSHKEINSYFNNDVELSATKKDNEIIYLLSTSIKF